MNVTWKSNTSCLINCEIPYSSYNDSSISVRKLALISTALVWALYLSSSTSMAVLFTCFIAGTLTLWLLAVWESVPRKCRREELIVAKGWGIGITCEGVQTFISAENLCDAVVHEYFDLASVCTSVAIRYKTPGDKSWQLVVPFKHARISEEEAFVLCRLINELFFNSTSIPWPENIKSGPLTDSPASSTLAR